MGFREDDIEDHRPTRFEGYTGPADPNGDADLGFDCGAGNMLLHPRAHAIVLIVSICCHGLLIARAGYIPSCAQVLKSHC